jgi:hypothetical protein
MLTSVGIEQVAAMLGVEASVVVEHPDFITTAEQFIDKITF